MGRVHPIGDEHGNTDDAEVRLAWPQTLVDMLDVAVQAFERDGYDVSTAKRLGKIVITELAKYHGGRQWYLPKGDALVKALRDKAIWDEHTGDNVKDLAGKWRLTEQQIYAILREQRAVHRRKVQPTLFD